jgi:outer membrane protein TolC
MSMSRLAAVVLCLCFWALPARAQEVQVPNKDLLAGRAFDFPRVAQPMMTLGQAVDVTIRQSPAVRRSVQALILATGRSRETRGVFDMTVNANPSLLVTREQLTPFLLNNELTKRAIIQVVADEFTQLTVGFRQLVSATPTGMPRCPGNLAITSPGVNLQGLSKTQVATLGLSRNLGSVVLINLAGVPQILTTSTSGDTSTSVNLGDICTKPIDPLLTPDAFGGVLAQIDESGGLGLNGVLTSVGQIPRDYRMLQEQISETVAFRAQLALDKLGPVPEDQLTKNIAINLTASKLFRNGIVAAGAFQTQSTEQNFVDKQLDPAFGGMGQPNEFSTSIAGDLTIPLLQGRGAVSTAAPERASARLVTAAREQLRFDVTDSVFGTVMAYINLATAQETSRLLAESAARNQQILTLTQQRATAGDIPGFEVGRVQAQVASIATSAAEARAAVQAARLTLATAMGVSVTSIDEAPLSQDALTTALVNVPEPRALLDTARNTRRDLRAAQLRQDAATILFAGARANTRRLVNLTLTGGYTNVYDSPLFTYLTGDLGFVIDQTTGVPVSKLSGVPPASTSPVRFYDPRGFYRSLTKRYTPFATVAVTWQLPFGNNAAKGRAGQADANLRTATIESTDLNRVIAHSVVASAEDLQRGSETIRASEATVQNDNTLLASMFQLLQTGDQTIIDTLLTEQSVTNDQLQLVANRQAYLTALAQLKFQAASLVTFDHEGTPDELIRFIGTDFVGR